MQNLISFLKRNATFRVELINSVESQHNSTIAERNVRTESKRNLTSLIKFRKHD